ncbi:MAG: T9SS type A sorting domain-containing protein [Saprospiraceae bacterium]|nr:T9SS type A sorting domain-containing protein [Saprospiraceae bacterium]
MVIKARLFLTLMLSTIFVLSIQAQYYVQKLLDDEVQKGELLSISQSDDQKLLMHLSIVYNSANIYSDILLNESNGKSISIIKDFYPPDQWMYFWGRSLKYDKEFYYVGTRDIFFDNTNIDSVGWSYHVFDNIGNEIINKKYLIKPIGNTLGFCHGIEVVKNGEILLWGENRNPNLPPNLNDPHISWIRIKKDGTFISGPHYYKPPSMIGWAIPTDATLDIDSSLVIVLDNKVKGKEKYVLKIRSDDTVEVMVQIDLTNNDVNDYTKVEVTKNGHFIVTNYDKDYFELPVLNRIDRNNNILWKSAFEIPYGWRNNVYKPNISKIFLNRIREISNGDILVCGINHQIESFEVDSLGTQRLKSGYTGSFMARFAADGQVKWAHFLIDPDDTGGLNKIRLNDIIEMEDGSILVGGELGVKNDINRSTPFYMKLGPNGCFDERCSHVDKWWYFPEDIVSVSDPEIIQNKLTLFPNPGKDQVSVLLPEIESNEIAYRYAVYDIKGQSHIQGVMQSEDSIINTNFLPSGMYFIALQDVNGSVWHGKWVKE